MNQNQAQSQNQSAGPNRGVRYAHCSRGHKAALLALAIFAAIAMVFGGQNLLAAGDVLFGQRTTEYVDSYAMRSDLSDAAHWLINYEAWMINSGIPAETEAPQEGSEDFDPTQSWEVSDSMRPTPTPAPAAADLAASPAPTPQAAAENPTELDEVSDDTQAAPAPTFIPIEQPQPVDEEADTEPMATPIPPEVIAQQVEYNYRFLEDSGYSFCLLSYPSQANATAEEIQAMPLYARVYEHGYVATVIQDRTPRTLAEPADQYLVGYIGLTAEELDRREAENDSQYEAGLQGILIIGIGGLLLAGCALALMIKAGRRPESEDVFLVWYDRIYLDLQAAALIAWGVCGSYAIGLLYDAGRRGRAPTLLVLGLELFICVGLALFTIAFLTSASRRWKRGELLRHTLTGAAILWCWRLVVRFFRFIGKLLRALSPTALTAVLTGAFLIGIGLVWAIGSNMLSLFLAAALAAAVVLYLYTERSIADGARRMRKGEPDARIAAPPLASTLQKGLIDDLNHVAEGMEQAVTDRVRAQSMRTELITNVSHDLKTPLTSILAYVELLKQEELPEPASGYVNILSEKSERLKRLTEDLFEAAKAASGSIPLKLESLDVVELLKQGLAELEDRIAASALDWRTDLPGAPLLAMADGRYLWRVVENLAVNAIKYAMPGTRVYLTAEEAGERIAIRIKNTSREPLNIPAERLTERFVRGDASRASEGSGLGLSIAKSLTEGMGGTFAITIDGDLFKVEVEVPKAEG